MLNKNEFETHNPLAESLQRTSLMLLVIGLAFMIIVSNIQYDIGMRTGIFLLVLSAGLFLYGCTQRNAKRNRLFLDGDGFSYRGLIGTKRHEWHNCSDFHIRDLSFMDNEERFVCFNDSTSRGLGVVLKRKLFDCDHAIALRTHEPMLEVVESMRSNVKNHQLAPLGKQVSHADQQLVE